MSWYKNIKYAANPKQIVNQWKVDDPFLKYFIYTYEPLIDLSKVKNQNDLKTYIQTDLIPSLHSKIDRKNPDGYYKKTMTDIEAQIEMNEHPDDHRTERAIRIAKSDPKGAKKILIDAINEDKNKSFDKWWKYMENDYPDNPAFFFSMLKPMIEKSPSSQKNGPPPAHKEAVSEIEKEIKDKGVTQMNIFKKFGKISFQLDKDTSESIDIDKNKAWVRVDSRLRDGKNYESNREKLMRFSTGSGWCVAGEDESKAYLSQGDFWLYFEKKSPKAAIRLHGNKKVEEIRGLYNQQHNLDPLWEPVTSFLHKSDFNYQNNSFYKHLKEIMSKNVNLKELEETDPEKFKILYQSFLDSIIADPQQIGQISKENKENYPNLVKAAAEGYEKKLNKLLDKVEKISTVKREYQSKFSEFQDEYNGVPDEVKPYMSNDIEGRLVSVHRAAFMQNPLEYEFFPKEMQKTITDQDKKDSWTNYVGDDPYRYNDTRMDEMGVRRYIRIKPILDGWVKLVNQNINHAYNIPDFILNITNSKGQRFFPENYIEKRIIADFKKYPCNRTSKGYEKLDKIKEMGLLTEDQIVQVYTDFINRNANNKKMRDPVVYVPLQYRDIAKSSLTDITPLVDKYYQQVLSNAENFGPIDDQNIRNALLNDNRYRNGIINSFDNLRVNDYGNDWINFWIDIPDDIKAIMPDNVIETVSNLWLPQIQNNSNLINNLDNIMRNAVERKMQPQQPLPPTNQTSAKNWYGRILS